MQLTLFSDYALRIALYLAMHQDRLVSIDEISKAYGISKNHLVKVVARLTELGLVEPVRGRGGGLRLARRPEEINVGQVVRDTEPHLNLVECFDLATNTCPIAPACGLMGVLKEAQTAFLQALDRYSLGQFVPRRNQLVALWDKKKKGSG